MKTNSRPLSFSRRDFLRLAAVSLGTLAGGSSLAGCDKHAPAGRLNTPTAMPPSSTLPPVPTGTPAPIQTAVPAPTQTPVPILTPTQPAVVASPSLPEIVKFYPTVPSQVVQTHHTGVWSDKTLVPDALRQMLDASITRLTGLNDAREAWAALFKPGERIAIKVNAFSNSIIWTHVPLVTAVTDALQDAGIPAENIIIYDLRTTELKTAGFAINVDGSGVRTTDTVGHASSEQSEVMKKKIKLAGILKECDALINMPVLKSHMMSGITFAMKNHYGSYSIPEALHSGRMTEIAALNALPEIKDRTRLIIGDALAANLRYAGSWPYWKEDWIGDSIFMSFDPVATDTLGLKLLTQELEKTGGNPASLIGMAKYALDYGTELGIGTNDPANMTVSEINLS